jgi:hypothetical protein
MELGVYLNIADFYIFSSHYSLIILFDLRARAFPALLSPLAVAWLPAEYQFGRRAKVSIGLTR